MDIFFIEKIIKKLEQKGWSIEKYKEVPRFSFSEEFSRRFKSIPNDFLFFLSHIESAISKDEQAWFICLQEYNDVQIDSFLWNQFEIISIDAAKEDNDVEWANRIKTFWDCYLPIMISLRSGYSFIAIGVCKENYGKIFHGIEPEFEEVSLIADSFMDFLNDFIQSSTQYPYNDFI